MKYYVGIDLGGTNIAVGVVDEEYRIVGRASVKTNCPRPAEEIADDMAKAAFMAVEDAGVSMDQVEWIGIGSPGTVDKEQGVVVYANNLDFHNVPVAKLIGERTGRKVYMDNDANAAAYGESIAGAAKGYKNVLAITLGTGVGGGIIIDGRIYGGFSNCGAELGHMGIVYDGRPCTCGRKGCIEAYASATGLINLTKEAMKDHPASIMWQMVDGDLNKVNGRVAFDAMRKGDETGAQVVDQYISYLAYGVSNFINMFQPEILVIGGGIGKEGENLLVPLREKVKKETYAKRPEDETQILSAKLGNDAGIIGAAFLGNMA